MFHKILLMVLFVALGPGLALAQERDYDDRWYIGVAGGAAYANGAREVDNWTAYYGAHLGRFFTPNLSLDLRLDQYQPEFEGITGLNDDFELTSYGLVGRYHFGAANQRTRPYVLLGTGIQEHRSPLDDGRDVFGSAGVGVKFDASDRASLRFEVEARYDNDRESFDSNSGFWDYLFTAGLNIRLGNRPAPAPASAPVAPAPVVRPTPPPPPPTPEPEPEVVFEFDAMVSFELDSAVLASSARARLNQAVGLLIQHPELTRLEVAGHTCDLGRSDYNQGLSERRAQAVFDYLVSNGISRERLIVRGYGEDRPKVANRSEADRQQNRRVELIVRARSDR